MAEFAVDFMHALGIDKAHWIGESRGGGICIELGSRWPDAVDHLVLNAPVGLPPRELPKPADVDGRSEWEWFVERSVEDPTLFGSDDREMILANLHKAASYERRRLASQPAEYDQNGLVEYIVRLRAPVLLTWGRQDPVFPVECVERFRQLLPNLQRVLILEAARHLAFFEKATEFNTAVTQFLAGPQ